MNFLLKGFGLLQKVRETRARARSSTCTNSTLLRTRLFVASCRHCRALRRQPESTEGNFRRDDLVRKRAGSAACRVTPMSDGQATCTLLARPFLYYTSLRSSSKPWQCIPMPHSHVVSNRCSAATFHVSSTTDTFFFDHRYVLRARRSKAVGTLRFAIVMALGSYSCGNCE